MGLRYGRRPTCLLSGNCWRVNALDNFGVLCICTRARGVVCVSVVWLVCGWVWVWVWVWVRA